MEDSKKETKQLLITSGIVDFVLGVVKVVIGLFSNSYALVVDGIHSFTDLATDMMVWIFNEIGTQEPDEDHPYGHARFETFGTLILGILLVALAAFLVYDSIMRLLAIDQYPAPTWSALIAVFISIATKEWLYQVTAELGKKTRSRLLQANAWHHRTDSFSSIIVLIGVIGALMGVPWFELLAAIGVALMIAMIGWSLSRRSVEELVDTSLSEAYVNEIKNQIEHVEGVHGVHGIRTRRMGADAMVDIHLQVDPSISVSEGHHIGDWVIKHLLNQFTEVNDVFVHIDAEDDEDVDGEVPSKIAPLRREVRAGLSEVWDKLLPQEHIHKMNLHYLNNKIEVEIFLAGNSEHQVFSDTDQLQAELLKASSQLPWLRHVTIWRD